MVNTLQIYHFISKFANKMSQKAQGLSPDRWVLRLQYVTKTPMNPERTMGAAVTF